MDAEYAIEVIGGKHDGVAGMFWTDDGGHPPPERIVVGTCTGGGECGDGRRAACRQYALLLRRANGGGVGSSRALHPAYWTLGEEFVPVDGETYRLTDVRAGDPDVAVYVVAGVGRGVPGGHAAEVLTVADILAAKPPAPATVAGARRNWPDDLRPGRHDRGWS